MCFALAGALWGCRQGFDQNERARVERINSTMVRQITVAHTLTP